MATSLLALLDGVLQEGFLTGVHIVGGQRWLPAAAAQSGGGVPRLWVVVRGERTVLQEEALPLGAGSAVLVTPGTVVGTLYAGPEETQTLSVNLAARQLRLLDVRGRCGAGAQPARRGTPVDVLEVPNRLHRVGRSCLDALLSLGVEHAPWVAPSLVRCLLSEVRSAVRAPAGSANAHSGRCLAVQAFVEENCTEPLTRREVASALRLHPNHVSRLLRQHGGETFTECLSRCRVERALHLLADPRLAVKEVAYRAGFGHVSHFNRVFRRQFHMTPSQYREGVCSV